MMVMEQQKETDMTKGNALTSYRRTIYFEGCKHKTHSYINDLKLGSYYFCDKCVLFRKISEIVY